MKCSFCGKEMERGVGTIYAHRDGTVSPFCSKKCGSNAIKLKRKPQKVKWTERYHEEKSIRMHGKKEKVEKAEKKEKTKKKASRAERKAKREAKKTEKKKVKKRGVKKE